jgi:hypothetical protein
VPRFPFSAVVLLVAATVAVAAALAIDPAPLSAASGALLAAAGLVITVVAAAGVLLAKGRWSRRLGTVLAALWLGVGIALDATAATIVVLAASAGALFAFAGPWLSQGWLRHLPSAQGPPPAAVVADLAVLSIPVLVALARPGGPGPLAWALAGTAVVLAWGLSRASRPALWAIRLVLPALGVAAGLAAGAPGGIVLGAGAVLAAAPAWHPDVGRTLRPALTRRAGGVPIPPELAPTAVLEAAGIDDRGRPKEESR